MALNDPVEVGEPFHCNIINISFVIRFVDLVLIIDDCNSLMDYLFVVVRFGF